MSFQKRVGWTQSELDSEWQGISVPLRRYQAEGHPIWTLLEFLVEADYACGEADFEGMYTAYKLAGEEYKLLDTLLGEKLARLLGVG